jgi:transcription antitermination protein NusB
MGLRHLGRELALQALYQMDLSGARGPEDPAAFFATFPADERAREFAIVLVEGVRRERALLDKHLADALENWSIERLSRVDHNILRLALYELMRLDDIPARVTIDEAIELAKRFGDRESGRFVNGVMDQLAKLLGLKHKGEDLVSSKPE